MFPAAVGSIASAAGRPLGGAFDLASLLDAPPELRAGLSFLLTVLFGGALIYRYGGHVDRLVDTSMSSPLASALYGALAYGLAVFVVGYAYSQLSLVLAGSVLLRAAVAVALALVVLSLGGLGFVVVGAWAARAAGVGDPWLGLIGVGGVAAAAWLVLPVVGAALVWLAIAAVGVGGPTRRWIHADAADARARRAR
jgi:hypothetical protein